MKKMKTLSICKQKLQQKMKRSTKEMQKFKKSRAVLG